MDNSIFYSNCCGAEITDFDSSLCPNCLEHCDFEPEDKKGSDESQITGATIEEQIKKLQEQIKKLKKSNWTKQSMPAQELEWGIISDKEMNWEEAKIWCEKQGGRLPTKMELLQAYKDNIMGFQSFSYWSAAEGNATGTWCMNSYNGSTLNFNKAYGFYVRCVRGGVKTTKNKS